MIEEPVFTGLAREAVREYLDWEQLTHRPLPSGLSAAETWRLLQAIRRIGSIRFPIIGDDGTYYWYALPASADRYLQTIERHCRADSSLHRALLERDGRRFIVRSRIQEAIAVCQLDGVRLSREASGRLLHESRTPRDATERLVANTYDLLCEIEDFSDETFSPDFLRWVYERVTHGVDRDALQRGPVRYNLVNVINEGTLSPQQAEQVLGQICDYGNGVTGDPGEAVAVKAYAFVSTMGYWHPLPDFNGIVARYALRVFGLKHGYPVLGYLPFSKMTLDWVEGRVDPGIVRWREPQRAPGDPMEYDYTPDVLTSLQLQAAAVDWLVEYVERTRKRDEDLLAVLENHEELNYRQRSVLNRALSRPGAEFRIRYHQTTHHVVYATARADLLDLVEKGYLRKELRGRAFVFVAVADLRGKLGAPSAA